MFWSFHSLFNYFAHMFLLWPCAVQDAEQQAICLVQVQARTTDSLEHNRTEEVSWMRGVSWRCRQITCFVLKSEHGIACRGVKGDIHGLGHLPELYDSADARAEEDHIAGLTVQEIQEDHQLHSKGFLACPASDVQEGGHVTDSRY